MPRASLYRSHLCAALVAAGALFLTAAPAAAQANSCADGQKYFVERQKLMEQFSKLAGKNKQVDPRAACPVLTKLAVNGEAGVKWLEGNKDWCQVPEQLSEGFTKELDGIRSTRKQACDMAAKVAAMEKQARQQAQQGAPGGFLGGNSLTGEFKVPKGALEPGVRSGAVATVIHVLAASAGDRRLNARSRRP